MDNNDFTMRLCGADVTVNFSDAGDWSRDGMGRCNSFTGQIQLSSRLTEATRHQTFMHELVHMILDFHGYNKLSCEEGVVNALSLSLLAWMRDNPELVQMIARGPAKDDSLHKEHLDALIKATFDG